MGKCTPRIDVRGRYLRSKYTAQFDFCQQLTRLKAQAPQGALLPDYPTRPQLWVGTSPLSRMRLAGSALCSIQV